MSAFTSPLLPPKSPPLPPLSFLPPLQATLPLSWMGASTWPGIHSFCVGFFPSPHKPSVILRPASPPAAFIHAHCIASTNHAPVLNPELPKLPHIVTHRGDVAVCLARGLLAGELWLPRRCTDPLWQHFPSPCTAQGLNSLQFDSAAPPRAVLFPLKSLSKGHQEANATCRLFVFIFLDFQVASDSP